ncbi:MAG: gamma carbonic anhydrase family protein [Polyangiaceae bacterium]|nr:gamma carbonic anhydrase family protein [Polyangiaceae bacterium]NUQ74737.1 gamma carbonic anhydrase family protein [Polyangiaceae bacterium]
MAIVLPYLEVWPRFGRDVFLAPNAVVTGDVELGDEVSVWFGAVLRGDSGSAKIGPRTNIQDLACVHMTRGLSSAEIGADVTVGHGAILHGCKVGNGCLIGMGAILLDNAEIGEGSIVAAGALVPARAVIPPRSLVVGSPGKVTREVTPEETERILRGVAQYVETARSYGAVRGDLEEKAISARFAR